MQKTSKLLKYSAVCHNNFQDSRLYFSHFGVPAELVTDGTFPGCIQIRRGRCFRQSFSTNQPGQQMAQLRRAMSQVIVRHGIPSFQQSTIPGHRRSRSSATIPPHNQASHHHTRDTVDYGPWTNLSILSERHNDIGIRIFDSENSCRFSVSQLQVNKCLWR